MKQKKENITAVLSILSVPLLNGIYKLLNNDGRSVHNIATALDYSIPFVKEFIIPYSIWYPFIMLGLLYLCFKDRKVFVRTVISIDIGLICCYIVYMVYQTTVPRPVLTGDDIFTKLVSITYTLDEPYNCFPSIHVLTSYLVMKAFYYGGFRGKLIKGTMFLVGSTIIISTLLIKQHFIADIFGAILLSEIIYSCITLIIEERSILWIRRQYSSLMMKKKLET